MPEFGRMTVKGGRMGCILVPRQSTLEEEVEGALFIFDPQCSETHAKRLLEAVVLTSDSESIP